MLVGWLVDSLKLAVEDLPCGHEDSLTQVHVAGVRQRVEQAATVLALLTSVLDDNLAIGTPIVNGHHWAAV